MQGCEFSLRIEPVCVREKSARCRCSFMVQVELVCGGSSDGGVDALWSLNRIEEKKNSFLQPHLPRVTALRLHCTVR